MRLALSSDMHGNPRALDAVLADSGRQGEVDAYWVLGDLVALGYDPLTPRQTIAYRRLPPRPGSAAPAEIRIAMW